MVAICAWSQTCGLLSDALILRACQQANQGTELLSDRTWFHSVCFIVGVQAAKIAEALGRDTHYTVDEKQKNVLLTEEGYEAAEDVLAVRWPLS